MAKRKADVVERVYDRAKEMAMEFSFEPGQKVKEGELGAELGVSRIPVREALNRLVSEGFMTFVPNRGFFCRGIDLDEILSLYQLRAALETWAFRTACRGVSEAKLQGFVADWSRSAVTERFGTLNAYDAEFHSAMAGLAGNPLLIAQLRQIAEKIAAFRNLDLEDSERRIRTLNEHEAIVAALAARQSEAGARLLERHILDSAQSAIAAARTRFAANLDAGLAAAG